jgi:hypothetical protein
MIFALVNSSPVHAVIYIGTFILLALVGFAFINGGKGKNDKKA